VVKCLLFNFGLRPKYTSTKARAFALRGNKMRTKFGGEVIDNKKLKNPPNND